MSRYIDADNAIERLGAYLMADAQIEYGGLASEDIDDWKPIAIDMLKGAPSIDIVFCKECKYFIDNLTENDTDETYDACRWDWKKCIPKPDGFCSYGTRSKMEQVDKDINVRSKDEQQKDCNGCKFVGTYDTEFPCANCSRKTKDYYANDEPQTERSE